jgi:hypothetical protein
MVESKREQSLEVLSVRPAASLPQQRKQRKRRRQFGEQGDPIVQALLDQREHSCQTEGCAPLSLTLDDLASHLGLAHETPVERRRLARNLQTTIFRANTKLAKQELTIASLYALGQWSYAIFRFSEIWGRPHFALEQEITRSQEGYFTETQVKSRKNVIAITPLRTRVS